MKKGAFTAPFPIQLFPLCRWLIPAVFETIPAQHRFVSFGFKRYCILFTAIGAGYRKIPAAACHIRLLFRPAIRTSGRWISKSFFLIEFLLTCSPNKWFSAVLTC